MLTRLRLTSIATISIALHAPLARAQNAEAESLFDQGESLEKAGKMAEACAAFESSNRIEPRAGTLIRLGDCRERNHQLASAWSAYKGALTRVKDDNKRQIATDKVTALMPRMSYLTVHVAAASQLAGFAVTRNGQAIDAVEWNQAVPLDGGTYAIEAQAPGHVAWKSSVSLPDENGHITVDVPALADQPRAPTAVPVAVQLPPQAPREVSMWTGKRDAAVIAAGVTVLAGVGGIVLGVLAKGKQDDADKLCPGQLCNSVGDMTAASTDLSQARSRALDANVAFGLAGAAAIASGVLWLTGAPERPQLAVVPVPGAAVITFSGRF